MFCLSWTAILGGPLLPATPDAAPTALERPAEFGYLPGDRSTARPHEKAKEADEHGKPNKLREADEHDQGNQPDQHADHNKQDGGGKHDKRGKGQGSWAFKWLRS